MGYKDGIPRTSHYSVIAEEDEAKIIKLFTTEHENGDGNIAHITGIRIQVVSYVINKYIRTLRKKMKRDGKII